MIRYHSLAHLCDGYASGALPADCPLVVDNDTSYVYVGDECVFRGGGPHDLIAEALSLAGIPTVPA